MINRGRPVGGALDRFEGNGRNFRMSEVNVHHCNRSLGGICACKITLKGQWGILAKDPVAHWPAPTFKHSSGYSPSRDPGQVINAN